MYSDKMRNMKNAIGSLCMRADRFFLILNFIKEIKMKKIANVLSIIALVSIIALSAIACKDDASDVEKTLVITGISKTVYDNWVAAPRCHIFVVRVGADPADESKRLAYVRLNSAEVQKEGTDPVKLTIQLKNNGKAMTESGTFDIHLSTNAQDYALIKDWHTTVNFSSATTTVEFSKFISQ